MLYENFCLTFLDYYNIIRGNPNPRIRTFFFFLNNPHYIYLKIIEFSEDDHLKVLKHVLENKTIEEEGELKSRFNAMRTQLQDRTLHIIGDLGLDPQSDDYLCYALAAYLYKTLK